MNSKERLMAAIRKMPIDRPPVSFYELNGIDENPSDPDPFNIFTDPSWQPLIKLTSEKTDRIAMRKPEFFYKEKDPLDELQSVQIIYTDKGSREIITEIRADGRLLRQRTKQDKDINTIWHTEHLLKDENDLMAWIRLPERSETGILQIQDLLAAEKSLGDNGIVMVDIADALCVVAGLFSMENFTITALTQNSLFHQAMEKVQCGLLRKVETISKEFPGRLWRIYGPEYASPPYLPPRLYDEYVVRYDTQLIKAIHKHGGYARIHQHGNMRDLLHLIDRTGCIGIDPVEPPPQGDVSLAFIRKQYEDRFVLFGNLEIADIELMDSRSFGSKVVTAIEEGMDSHGSGFVLMPSACPYGRVLSPVALENYYKMIETIENYK